MVRFDVFGCFAVLVILVVFVVVLRVTLAVIRAAFRRGLTARIVCVEFVVKTVSKKVLSKQSDTFKLKY